MTELVHCRRLGPVLRVVAKEMAEALGFSEPVVCSTCKLPVDIGPCHIERIKAGDPIICTVCERPPNIRYEGKR